MAFGPCGPCGGGPLMNPFGGPASSPFATNLPVVATPQLGPIITPDTPPPDPDPVGPDAVDLGTAANFKILTKTGITNVPTSSIIGDMGVSPITDAAITGFALVLDGSGEFSTSAQVVGSIYAANYAPPTPAMLTQAVLDMEAAYTDAAGRPPQFVNVNAGIIGGLVLVPGVYKWTSGVTIPTDITFLGGPGDTWILQIDGTLGVSSGVELLLAGGANKNNIVWQVAGAITIGTNAKFKGNILAQTNIVLQTGAEQLGKLLAQTAVTLDQNFVNG